MASLVAYESSDEEENEETREIPSIPDAVTATVAPTASAPSPKDKGQKGLHYNSNAPGAESAEPLAGAELAAIAVVQQSAVPLGPSLPPMADPVTNEQDEDREPMSPFLANRALLRDLTLPTVPNLDIPPSPPGSPSGGASKKFEQFLELKKKGIHFNAKLEQSLALKNPSLMDKLMTFVELSQVNQYSTTLPTGLWDPAGFPDWAYRENLRRQRESLNKEKAAERASGTRTTIDFVPSTAPTAASSSGNGGLIRGEKRKGGWE